MESSIVTLLSMKKNKIMSISLIEEIVLMNMKK